MSDLPGMAEAVEAVARAMYEATRRDSEHLSPEYDWPYIDAIYDRCEEDDGDPEWLRNGFRDDARGALAAAYPVIAAAVLDADRERIATAIERFRDDDRAERVADADSEPCDAEHWECHASGAFSAYTLAASVARAALAATDEGGGE